MSRKSSVNILLPEILGHFRNGFNNYEVAKMAKISYPTMLNWYKRGRNGEKEFIDFFEAVYDYWGLPGRPLKSSDLQKRVKDLIDKINEEKLRTDRHKKDLLDFIKVEENMLKEFGANNYEKPE